MSVDLESDENITSDTVKDALRDLLRLVPGAHQMIAERTKKFTSLRDFWREVCEECHDWDGSLKKTDVRKFFKSLELESFYTKHAQKRYTLLQEIYEDLHTCISDKALTMKYEGFAQIKRIIPEVSLQNKERIDHALIACRAYIELKMHEEDEYTAERSKQLEFIFKVLNRHFMRISSDLPTPFLENLD